MAAKRSVHRRLRIRRRLVAGLTLAVLAAQALLLLVFESDPYRPPLLPLPTELWAMDRRWQFDLLVGVVGGGLVGTAVAWIPGRWWPTRTVLLAGWVCLTAAVLTRHGERLAVMIDLMQRHG